MLSITVSNDDNKEKLIRLYNEYASPLFYVADDILKNKSDSEDALHDTFVRIVDHLDKLDEDDKAKTFSFLAAVCRNVAINIYNAKTKLNNKSELYEDIDTKVEHYNDALSIVINEESIQELVDKLNQLEPKYSNILDLRVIQGFSYLDISKMTGLQQTTARKRVERARAQLIELYRKEIVR